MTVLLMAMLLAGVAPAKVTHKVQIDGKTYRVSVRGGAFEAADKSAFTTRTPDRGAVLRRAVVQATGCALKDEYWEGAKLRGLLDCP